MEVSPESSYTFVITQDRDLIANFEFYNNPPVADDLSVTTDEDTSVDITLTGSDPEGDELTYEVTSDPSNGSLTGDAPNITYIPNADYNGSDSFTFSVSDGELSDEGTVSITVNAVNDPPELTAIDNQSMEEDGILSFALSSSDIDGGEPSYSASSDEPNVSAVVDGNELTLTPVPDWNGTANITVTVDDGSGGTDDETFELMVNPVNDAPTIYLPESFTF